MGARVTEVTFVGDLILHARDPMSYFTECRSALTADVTVGQVEWPHTGRGQVCAFEVPAPAAPSENLAALAELGFMVATTASNHTFDQGPDGVADTVDELRRLGIATTGSGMTLARARGARRHRGRPIFHGINHFVAAYESDSNPAEFTWRDGEVVFLERVAQRV
jgi:poly-gamma-glutamate capsule biosynthesis protein CapA/YwtB (metallophosphatase superfamily)